jgi:hypothetical protein
VQEPLKFRCIVWSEFSTLKCSKYVDLGKDCTLDPEFVNNQMKIQLSRSKSKSQQIIGESDKDSNKHKIENKNKSDNEVLLVVTPTEQPSKPSSLEHPRSGVEDSDEGSKAKQNKPLSRLLSTKLARLAKDTTRIAVEVPEMEVDSEPEVEESVGDKQTKDSGIEHYMEAMRQVVREEVRNHLEELRAEEGQINKVVEKMKNMLDEVKSYV